MADHHGAALASRYEALGAVAVELVSERLAGQIPALAEPVGAWMRSLSAGRPESYFTHPEAFPMLQLPSWVEESLTSERDDRFLADVSYSTVCGYYFVRLLDDLMDGEDVASPVLPAMIFFHTEFQLTYQRLFGAASSFWVDFRRFSYEAAQTASADARMESIDREQFARISSRKVAGAKIPVAAACHRRGVAPLVERWAEMVDTLGRWHQMRNDVLGWVGDQARGRVTYFLSEAERRAGGSHLIGEWIAREGVDWAVAELERSMDQAESVAHQLGSPSLVAYLETRRRSTTKSWQELRQKLAELERIAVSLDGRQTGVGRGSPS